MMIKQYDSTGWQISDQEGEYYYPNMTQTQAINLYQATKQKELTRGLDYRILRMQAYPSIQEQLNMMYWDTVNGTNKWVETISEIKKKYPKE